MKKKKDGDSPLPRLIEHLIGLTTVPKDKSVIQWKMRRVVAGYVFETEYKGNIYFFGDDYDDYFLVYPAGHELLPGVSMGDKKGPEPLVNASIRHLSYTMPFGQLLFAAMEQNKKELDAETEERERQIKNYKKMTKALKKQEAKNLQNLLEDFEEPA